MVKFFDTALGKSTKTLLWVVLSYTLAIAIPALTNYHYPTSVAVLGIPGVVLFVLQTLNVFVDKQIPNLPSSPVKMLVELPPAPPPTPATENPATPVASAA